MPDKPTRFKVVFTPVGWHVVDTQEARDPVAQFGTGAQEYERAVWECECLNERGDV
jgi:hypothetical protein